jgi:hypothetical protein
LIIDERRDMNSEHALDPSLIVVEVDGNKYPLSLPERLRIIQHGVPSVSNTQLDSILTKHFRMMPVVTQSNFLKTRISTCTLLAKPNDGEKISDKVVWRNKSFFVEMIVPKVFVGNHGYLTIDLKKENFNIVEDTSQKITIEIVNENDAKLLQVVGSRRWGCASELTRWMPIEKGEGKGIEKRCFVVPPSACVALVHRTKASEGLYNIYLDLNPFDASLLLMVVNHGKTKAV